MIFCSLTINATWLTNCYINEMNNLQGGSKMKKEPHWETPRSKRLILLMILFAFTISASPGFSIVVKTYKIGSKKLVISDTSYVELYDKDSKFITSGRVDGIIKNTTFLSDKQILFLIVGQMNAQRGEYIAAFRIGKNEIKLMFKDRNRQHNPWKLQAVDIDNDGDYELCVGAYMNTRFDPQMRNRLHIYDITATEIVPKWMGTKFLAPMKDFKFFDISDAEEKELLLLEKMEDGFSRLNIYKWNGFGFDLKRTLINRIKVHTFRELGIF